MNITDIQKTKRGRFSVFIDDEFYGVLHPDIYYRFSFKIGSNIPQEELDNYIKESQIIIAKERALGLLSARAYTKKSLKEKLLRDVDEEAADLVVARMEELDLVDDADYARRYALDCINLKGYSHRHTARALAEKGISRDVIDDTLEDLGEEDSEALIYKQIKKKYFSSLGTEKGERKTIQGLQRKGFLYSDIRQVIKNLQEDSNYYEYDDPWE